MSNYREKMREYLKEPNEYSSQYGKWGALNIEQRQLINRLLNEMDSADVVIKKQYKEKKQLISFLEDKIKEYSKLIKNPNYRNQVKCLIYTYQEILDFINKGGKDE